MLQKCSTDKVLKVFFNEPTKKYSLKEISTSSKIAHTSVKKILNELLNNKIISSVNEKKGKRNFPTYKSNLEESYYRKLKFVSNLEEISQSLLIEKLDKLFMPKSIVLFGSYSRGEDIEESDIDIFVEAPEEEINLIKFEKKLSRKINLHFSKNINNLSSQLKENIINGVVLMGEIELK